MKHILLGLLVVLSFNTYAKNNKAMTGTLKATVDEVFCGEMDPMVWGDICLILVSKGNKKYGIVADHEGFFEDYDLEGEASQLNGHPITVDFTEVERIESKSKRRILRRYAKGYFFVTASSAKAMSFPYAERATSYNDKFYKAGLYVDNQNVLGDGFYDMVDPEEMCFRGSIYALKKLVKDAREDLSEMFGSDEVSVTSLTVSRSKHTMFITMFDDFSWSDQGANEEDRADFTTEYEVYSCGENEY